MVGAIKVTVLAASCSCLLGLLWLVLRPAPVMAAAARDPQKDVGLRIPDLLANWNYADLTHVSSLEMNRKLTEIRPGDLERLPNLKLLRISHNTIQHLDPAAFIAVNGLEELSIAYTNLTKVPNFGEVSLFPNMTTLDLRANKISRLDNTNAFSSMVSLNSLHLQENRIEYLDPDIFKLLTNLTNITLSDNKITYIPDKLFHIQSLRVINLNKNLIRYVAPGAISSSSLERLFLEDNRLTHLPQHFVTQLKKASVSFELIELDENRWQCSCLQEVLAEGDSAGVRTSGQDFVACRLSDADRPTCYRPTLEEALLSSLHIMLEHN